MNTLFQNILTASFHGSIVILAVMLLRLVLKKTPRKYICLLWLLAGLRLLMPFQIQSDLSLQPSADPVAQVQQQISRSQTPAAPEDFSPADLDVPAPVQTPEALPDIQTPVTTVISSTPPPPRKPRRNRIQALISCRFCHGSGLALPAASAFTVCTPT